MAYSKTCQMFGAEIELHQALNFGLEYAGATKTVPRSLHVYPTRSLGLIVPNLLLSDPIPLTSEYLAQRYHFTMAQV